jgi:hypothetical protein
MPDQTEGFLNQIVVMLPAFRAVEERLDRETGRRFSVFDLFTTDEPATSRLLDVLLNPMGAHGQSDLFLRLFINRFVPEWRDTFAGDRAKLATTNQLIDVTITDNDRWLGIENKIFGAQEQKCQTDRYLDALKQASGQSQSGDYRLVYLSPEGEPPTEYSFTKEGKERHQGKLVIGAWMAPLAGTDAAQEAARESCGTNLARIENSLDWLAECEHKCRAENVRWFLRQFQTLVHNRLIGEEELNMTGDAIVDLALRSIDNLDAALRIGDQYLRIRERVVVAILTDVQRRLGQWVQLNARDWELNDTWPGGNWIKTPFQKFLPVLLRRKGWPSMVGAALVPDDIGPSKVFVGIMAPTQRTWDDDTSSVKWYGTRAGFIDDNTRQTIAAALGLATPDSPWWVNVEALRDSNDGQDISDWRTIETIKRLHTRSDELARQIVEKIQMLAQKLDAIVG